MNTILALYTILLFITIAVALHDNHRCHRLGCGIPMAKVIEIIGAPMMIFLLVLTMTVFLPITLAQNLYMLFLDDERFAEVANRSAITF